jgi:hypothetical protein
MVCGFGGCLAFCGGGTYYMVLQTEAPANEAKAFLTAFGKGDIPGAQSHMSAPYKQKLSAELLASLAAQHPDLSEIKDFTFGHRALTPEGATVGGAMTTASRVTPVMVALIQEGKAWRVDEVAIDDVPLGAAQPEAPRGPPGPPPLPAPPVQKTP